MLFAAVRMAFFVRLSARSMSCSGPLFIRISRPDAVT